MKNIGIDLSINSTGICVDDDSNIYYHIVSSDNISKKRIILAQDITNTVSIPLSFHFYHKITTNSTTYSTKENIKTLNITNISKLITDIIDLENPDHVYMEGISYRSSNTSALADLAGLQYIIRVHLINKNIPMSIVSPTSNKKSACGNGAADKSEMLYAWFTCDSRLIAYKDQLKLDDIADAYFLSKIEIESN